MPRIRFAPPIALLGGGPESIPAIATEPLFDTVGGVAADSWQ